MRLAALACLLLAVLPLTRVETDSGSAATANHDGWQVYSEPRLSQLLQSGSPVFVNLTADWCITCLANEKVVLATDEIHSAFDRVGMVRLKGDWTNYNPEITTLLGRYQRSGVPLYLMYSGRAGEAPIVLPQILSKKVVLAAIARQQSDNLRQFSG